MPWRLARLDPRLSVVAVTSAICVLRLYTCSRAGSVVMRLLMQILRTD